MRHLVLFLNDHALSEIWSVHLSLYPGLHSPKNIIRVISEDSWVELIYVDKI